MTTIRDPRTAETQQRRRQRAGGELVGQRLAVPSSILDHDRFRYRWINDDAARIQAKTVQDDWDIVANDGNLCESADLGNAVSRIVGTAPDGSALRSYLCRKPKRLYDDDQAEKSAELDRQIEQLRRGNDRAGGSQADYVPASGIRMR